MPFLLGQASGGSAQQSRFWRLLLLVALQVAVLPIGSATAQDMAAAAATPLAEPIQLRCRDRNGPWADCHLQVEEIGRRWRLLLDGQSIEFRHDGRGSVTMQRHRTGEPATTWVPVEPRWSEEQALCWDGICAQGDLPLD
ncbi:hypothetical protein [Cyanobium sp. NIES-981]|uniref:hypothetical protein n=1 Tax=Cyanobium sp. NIES-981 TaxID=1851505 RepID=UPI0007DCECC0|nr:hypothetical protein [Cyanobium sp. NIES-981]SBO42310.1 protein of unknown function [Cyanobium sp. NIES-981]